MPDQLLTSDDVAERLKVTRQFVNRLRARGDLPAVKFGGAYRYRPQDITLFIRNHLVKETQ